MRDFRFKFSFRNLHNCCLLVVIIFSCSESLANKLDISDSIFCLNDRKRASIVSSLYRHVVIKSSSSLIVKESATDISSPDLISATDSNMSPAKHLTMLNRPSDNCTCVGDADMAFKSQTFIKNSLNKYPSLYFETEAFFVYCNTKSLSIQYCCF